MRRLFLILLILFSGFALSQNIEAIRKTVTEINQTKKYTVKILPYEYFSDKNEVVDNGIELKGFYKNKKLRKIVHEVGLSAWQISTQYFFSGNEVIFVYAKKYRILDEGGYKKKPQLIGEYKGYFENGKLIKESETGDDIDEKKDYLKEAYHLKKDLEDYK